ncbi:transposase [Oligosphaera ethanolica]|uniref:transposase n=1 Tax=Oligosphaera ethanolica TaxID=760260 RepID=UPI0035215813
MLKGGTRGSHLNWLRRFSAKVKYGIIKKAYQPGGNIAELCRRHGISASTIYRWEAQLRARAKDGLVDRSGARRGPPKPKLSGYRPNRPRKTRLDWQMADQGVAHLSESAVYHILDSENPLCRWTSPGRGSGNAPPPQHSHSPA